MLALLHKDFLMLRKEKMVWLMLGLACLGGLISGAQPGAAVFLLFFPVYWATAYSNAYDYKYGAEAVLSSLPLPKAGIVGAKYLLALTVSLIAVVLAFLGGLLLGLAGPGAGRLMPGFLLAAFGLCNLFSAVALAAYFRFGYLKSRWIVIILFVVPSVAIGTFTGSTGGAAAGGAGSVAALAGFFSGLAAPAILVGASLAALALSCLYSSAVFARKEF
jgi:ABC-type transport system involved in multi-copper enzyme maturation permease subunit